MAKPVLAVTAVVVLASCAAPPPAAALNPTKPICTVAGLFSGLLGKACTAASHGKQLLSAGKKLLGGHLGGAAKTLLGGSTKAVTISASLAAMGVWVLGGAKFALHETAAIVSVSTTPQLTSSWFSSFYWRMAAVSALLTLPFLFAAAAQALMRSDLSLLIRSAFGYLPLGMLAVAIAAPVTTLLLAGSDEISHIVSGAAGNADNAFLAKAAGGGLLVLASKSAFLAFFVGLFTAAAALILWCELLIRSAAVYVIVLMLPLFFAAMVWPARRVWAVRAVEILVALILSKFAIVAVLALGGAAIGHSLFPSFAAMLAGATLILLAAFSPWALLRMLPLHELAAGAAAGLRSQSAPLSLGAIEAAAGLAEGHAERVLARGEPAEETPARTTVGRLDAPNGREAGSPETGGEAEIMDTDSESADADSHAVDADSHAVDANSEIGDADSDVVDTDRGPVGDSGDELPGSAVEPAAGADGVSSPGPAPAADGVCDPGPAPAADGVSDPGPAAAPGAGSQEPRAEAASADELSKEFGLMVRPGQTLHFSPRPHWSSEGAGNDADTSAAGADGGVRPSDQALPEEDDPLPPPQEPQDGRL